MSLDILFVDDHYEDLQQILDTLLRGIDPDARLHCARDFDEAQPICSQTPLALVLIDQYFDKEGLKLLDDSLNIANKPYPNLKPEQGFRIARRIAQDLGPLRPPLCLFTSKGGEIDLADAAFREGILDHYQAKPPLQPTGQEGDETTRIFCTFLRRYLNPIAYLELDHGLILDPTFRRFLTHKVHDWRRDTPEILDQLASQAREQAGVLTMQSWGQIKSAPTLQALESAWADPELWRVLLKPLGEFEPWHPWDDTYWPADRVRYFKLTADSNTKAKHTRILMLLDPTALKELTEQQRGSIEKQFKPFRTDRTLGPSRLDLPANAPGSRSPWLLGAWFDIPQGTDSNWIPLAVHRYQTLQKRQALRPALQEVMRAVSGDQRAGNREAYSYSGLLTEGVLINRTPGSNAFGQWKTPLFPMDLLGLHPDPQEQQRLPFSYLRNLETLNDWLHVMAYWFAWGRLPIYSNLSRDVISKGLQQLVKGADLKLHINLWWREEGRQYDSRDVIQRYQQLLDFPIATRCLGEPGTHQFQIHQRIHLENCRLRFELDHTALNDQDPWQGAVPLFEQMVFHKPVMIKNCLIQDFDGQPATLLIRDCVFLAELDLSSLQVQDILFERCEFQHQGDNLRIANCTNAGKLELRHIKNAGQVRLAQLNVQAMRSAEINGDWLLGPNLEVTGEARLEMGAGHLTCRHSRIHERCLLTLQDGAHVQIENCRFGGQIRCDVTAYEKQDSITIKKCDFTGEMRLNGKSFLSTPIAVSLEQLELEGKLRLNGYLDVSITDSQIMRNLEVYRQLSRLSLLGCRIGGDILLSKTRIDHQLEIHRCLIEQVFRAEDAELAEVSIQGSNCVGSFLCRGSRFRGALVIAQPGTESSAGANDDNQLTGVIFREQLDFSACEFQAAVDFSNTVVEHVARFEQAAFHANADFAALQAANNLLFNQARFHGQAHFHYMIATGVVDFQGAYFATAPQFNHSSFDQPVRCNHVSWPLITKKGAKQMATERPSGEKKRSRRDVIAVFADCLFNTRLDLSQPCDAKGDMLRPGRHTNVWVDLKGTIGESVVLDPAWMHTTINAEKKALRHVSGAERINRKRRITGVARLFENSLLREMRFQEADEFYRKANGLRGGAWSGFLGLLWGHGTLPWRVVIWMALITATMIGLNIGAAQQMDISGGELNKQLVETLLQVFLAQVPDFDNLPLWYLISATCLVIPQVVLLNLFFAALARRLLR